MPSFTLPIVPTPQARARHMSTGKLSRTYKSKKQCDNEDTIKTFLKEFVPQEALSGPVFLKFIAYMPIPKSKPRKWKEAANRGEEHHTKKPDLDNLAKNIKDCMTQMRFWEDDKQVVEMMCKKEYSYNPRWEVVYYALS